MSSNTAESGAQFELPQVPLEAGEQGQNQAVEQMPSAPEKASNPPAQQTPVLPSTPLPALADPSQPLNVVLNTPVSTDSGLPAADVDLIEKAWVQKAKDIVSKTQDDPYHQKSQISKVKAEYIAKRFNKTVKTEDTAP